MVIVHSKLWVYQRVTIPDDLCFWLLQNPFIDHMNLDDSFLQKVGPHGGSYPNPSPIIPVLLAGFARDQIHHPRPPEKYPHEYPMIRGCSCFFCWWNGISPKHGLFGCKISIFLLMESHVYLWNLNSWCHSNGRSMIFHRLFRAIFRWTHQNCGESSVFFSTCSGSENGERKRVDPNVQFVIFILYVILVMFSCNKIQASGNFDPSIFHN